MPFPSLILLRIPQPVKIRASFSEGERNTAGTRHMHSLIVPHSSSDSFRALETPLHLKYDLLWESRGVFCPCKSANGTYGRGLKMYFQHITQLIISSVLPSGLSYKGRRHSARLSLLSTNLTATCHEIVQERGPRADPGRHEKKFVVAD